MQKSVFLRLEYRRTSASLTRVYLDARFRAAEVVVKRQYTILWANMKTMRNNVDIIIVAKFRVRSR